ncbi:MAG: signal peptidase I [Clostridia bacterium]|nr:signal peptidase I [Clostridia bacterium]
MDENFLTQGQKDAPEKKDPIKEIFGFVELLAIAASVILLFFTVFARITVVDGDSMNNTLTSGDRLLVSDLFYTPSRGDIVIIQDPAIDGGNAIVKRVIAIAGDTVLVDKSGVFINGEKLNESDGSLGYTVVPYAGYRTVRLTVGEGEIFVLGDNRPISYDSEDFGTVDTRTVVGRVFFRIAPFSSFGIVK